jgi:hypothetical protein
MCETVTAAEIKMIRLLHIIIITNYMKERLMRRESHRMLESVCARLLVMSLEIVKHAILLTSSPIIFSTN